MAEQKLPLTDNPNFLPKDDSVSPLFNKMDALMARHRSPAGQHHEDIPVLTDIAPEAFDIPILTDVINEDLIQKIENIERSLAQAQSAKARRRLEEKLASENEQGIPSLMFSPRAAAVQKPVEPSPTASAVSEPIAEIDLELTPPTRFKPSARPSPAVEQPVFLDLPLLDLNAIETAPLMPSGKSLTQTDALTPKAFNFVADDLIIDFSTPLDTDISAELDINDFADESDSAVMQEAIQPETTTLEATSLEPEITETATLEPVESMLIEAVLVEVISSESADADLANVDLAIHLDPEPEVIESPAPIALAQLAVAATAAPSLHWEDDEHEHISLSVAEENHIEITLDEFHDSQGIEPEALSINDAIHIPEELVPEPQVIVEAEQHAEIEPEPEPETKTSTSLNADAIAELTAVVGAQLAVDIASEVEQLARQHFSKLMAQFYGDTLRELTGEISFELEARLAPRIVELVEQELISKGLIQK